jgi:hypothetical protein
MQPALRTLVWMPMAIALAACAGAPVLEQLDERAGMTLRTSAAPLVFARTDTRYSRSTRDYLYVAPLETNRQGVREYYLWVGVATTLDRGFLAPPLAPPRTLYVTIDGEPMELPLRPLAELVRRSSGGPVYATAVPVQAELGARVTLQQLELLDAAQPESLGVAADGQPARSYTLWDRAGGFGDFMTAVGP